MLRFTVPDSLRKLDRDLIGWHVPPVEVAFIESGWMPDEPTSYCMRCASTILAGPRTALGCVRCAGDGEPRLGDRMVRLGRHEGHLREWVLRVKYARWAEMGFALGRLLGAAVATALPPSHRGELQPVVVPMPMPLFRRLHRGIDHAAVIAAGVASSLEAPICQPLRRGAAPVQVMRTAAMRRAEGGVGIRLRAPPGRFWRQSLGGRSRWTDWGLRGRSVVLVDDVRTTGATLTKAVLRVNSLEPAWIVVAVVAVSEGVVSQL